MIMLCKNNLNTFQVTSADEFVWIDSHNRLVEVIILFLPISTVNINVNRHRHDPPSGPTAPVEQRRSSESGSARRSEGVGQQGWFQVGGDDVGDDHDHDQYYEAMNVKSQLPGVDGGDPPFVLLHATSPGSTRQRGTEARWKGDHHHHHDPLMIILNIIMVIGNHHQWFMSMIIVT